METFIDDGIGHETDFDPLLVLLEEVFKRLFFLEPAFKRTEVLFWWVDMDVYDTSQI